MVEYLQAGRLKMMSANYVYFGKFKMSKLLKITALILALLPISSYAQTFNFSYQFGSGDLITGSLTGDLNGLYVDNISNVSVALNGTPFVGSPNLFHPLWNEASPGCCGGNWDSGTPAVVSTDGNLNSFMFVDTDVPTDTNFMNSFYYVNTSGGLHHIAAYIKSPLANYFDSGADNASKWSLTPVPEPETYAMMMMGLGLIGFVARRRKNQQA